MKYERLLRVARGHRRALFEHRWRDDEPAKRDSRIAAVWRSPHLRRWRCFRRTIVIHLASTLRTLSLWSNGLREGMSPHSLRPRSAGILAVSRFQTPSQVNDCSPLWSLWSSGLVENGALCGYGPRRFGFESRKMRNRLDEICRQRSRDIGVPVPLRVRLGEWEAHGVCQCVEDGRGSLWGGRGGAARLGTTPLAWWGGARSAGI